MRSSMLKGVRMDRMLLLLSFSVVLLVGCHSKTDEAAAYDENGELLNEEKAVILERFDEPRVETTERPPANPDESIVVEMENGEMSHAFQVPAGRYAIADATGMSAGNVYVHSEDEELLFHDTLYGPVYSTYVIAITLEETDTISFDGLEGIVLQPLSTQYTNEIFSGVWEVGLDIEPGTYHVKPTVSGIGNLELFSDDEEPRVFEIIGLEAEGETGLEVDATFVTLPLAEGDTLRVTGMAGIHLEKVED